MNNKPYILIVDDQKEILNSLNRLFKKDYPVLTADSGYKALELMSEYETAVILSDQRMPEMDGVTFLQQARKLKPDAVRLMITGYADIDATIDAVNKAEIYQYISKPFEPDELAHIVNNAYERYQLVLKNKCLQEELVEANKKLTSEKVELQKQVVKDLDLGSMIGRSQPMSKVLKLVNKVVDTPTTVLILGETGTGKELLAKIIHYNSIRRGQMFVVQNCAAIPDTLLQSELFGHVRGAFTGAVKDKKGFFELADKGTIFLDEIGDTSPALQLGLLRVLQEGEIKPVGSNKMIKVDVRVIAATNRNLTEDVKSGKFREDLFYRLSVFPIELPPLSARKEDIPELIEFFITKYSERIDKPISGIEQDCLDLLMNASFPGNIRELENEIERMVTLAEAGVSLTTNLLSRRFQSLENIVPVDYLNESNLKDAVEKLERTMIERALKQKRGNILQSAIQLGISRVGLHKMLKRYEIEASVFKN